MTYLSLTEFSKRLGCTRQNVHLKIQAGEIKAIKVGNTLIIPVDELDKYKGEEDEQS